MGFNSVAQRLNSFNILY